MTKKKAAGRKSRAQRKVDAACWELWRKKQNVTLPAIKRGFGLEGDVLARKDRKRLADGQYVYKLVQNTDVETLENWWIFAPA